INTATSNVHVTPEPGTNYASFLSLGTPLSSDNCAVADVTNDAPGSFPLGTNLVTWTCTDIHGNSAVAIQQVIVTPAPRLPHRITSIARNSDGTFTLHFAGVSNMQYILQISSNFLNWAPIQTNTAGADG